MFANKVHTVPVWLARACPGWTQCSLLTIGVSSFMSKQWHQKRPLNFGVFSFSMGHLAIYRPGCAAQWGENVEKRSINLALVDVIHTKILTYGQAERMAFAWPYSVRQAPTRTERSSHGTREMLFSFFIFMLPFVFNGMSCGPMKFDWHFELFEKLFNSMRRGLIICHITVHVGVDAYVSLKCTWTVRSWVTLDHNQ